MTPSRFVVAPDEVDTIMADWVTAKVLSTPGLTGVNNMRPGDLHARLRRLAFRPGGRDSGAELKSPERILLAQRKL